jgi:hypothetical protein
MRGNARALQWKMRWSKSFWTLTTIQVRLLKKEMTLTKWLSQIGPLPIIDGKKEIGST